MCAHEQCSQQFSIVLIAALDAQLGALGQPLVRLRHPEHRALRSGIGHAAGDCARFGRTLTPAFRVVQQFRHSAPNVHRISFEFSRLAEADHSSPFSYDLPGCAKILADQRSSSWTSTAQSRGVKVPKRVGGSKSNDDALGLLHEKMVIWSRYDPSLLTCACALACDRHHRGWNGPRNAGFFPSCRARPSLRPRVSAARMPAGLASIVFPTVRAVGAT